MMPYASWTGTRRTLRALQSHGWRLLMSPDTLNRVKGKRAPRWPDGSPAGYALDNGAYGAFLRGSGFDDDAFLWAVESIGERADFVVIPDTVADRDATLSQADSWFDRLSGLRLMLAVQDGMHISDIEPWFDRGVGVFVGGSTTWKLRTMNSWCKAAKSAGTKSHIGRVNTVKRIRMCQYAGADSFDGTSVTRYSCNIHRLDSALRQGCLF